MPILLIGGTIWLGWRLVNYPPFADFLIATEAEMNKVSWTTRKRLVQDTIIVLMTMLLSRCFYLWSTLCGSRSSAIRGCRFSNRTIDKQAGTEAARVVRDPGTGSLAGVATYAGRNGQPRIRTSQTLPCPRLRVVEANGVPRKPLRSRAGGRSRRNAGEPERSNPKKPPAKEPNPRPGGSASKKTKNTGTWSKCRADGKSRSEKRSSDACKIEGLEEFFSKIIIPVEKTAEMRNGKRVVKDRKLYPGYLMVEVEYNDRILYLFRETSGVGDFVGGSLQHAPPPMTDREVERMLGRQGDKEDVKIVHHKPKYDRGDRVKVKEGTFAGMEGEVKELIEAKGQVRVELTIFGRPVPVELEYWQVEHV